MYSLYGATHQRFTQTYKKVSYRRGTARRAVSLEVLSTAEKLY